MLVFHALDEHVDRVAGLELGGGTGGAEFLEGHAAFGLEAHIDDGEIAFDRNDAALDDAAVERAAFAERFLQQGCETVAGCASAARCGRFVAGQFGCFRHFRIGSFGSFSAGRP